MPTFETKHTSSGKAQRKSEETSPKPRVKVLEADRARSHLKSVIELALAELSSRSKLGAVGEQFRSMDVEVLTFQARRIEGKIGRIASETVVAGDMRRIQNEHRRGMHEFVLPLMSARM